MMNCFVRRGSVATALLVVVTAAAYAQSPPRRPPRPTQAATPQLGPLTDEKAFFYFIAIYGTPADVIERYGMYFDSANYHRAMANEFERSKYAAAIRARVEQGIQGLKFSDTFVLVGSTTSEGYTSLGEYSFESQSFPLFNVPYESFCRNLDRSSGICQGSLMDITNARMRDAVNAREFLWRIPMSETEASAFVKGRSNGATVNRRVAARVTYSVTSKKGKTDSQGRGGSLSPYVHSVEVFTDESLSKKLGVITPNPGTPLSAFLPEAVLTATFATKVLGTYRYKASCREPFACKTPIIGTLTLSDAGISLSGERQDGTVSPLARSFIDAFSGDDISLMRADFTHGTWGTKDYRVVWRPFWQYDHDSALNFAEVSERDRFFADLVLALERWAAKFPQFAHSRMVVDQECLVSTRRVPCSSPKAGRDLPVALQGTPTTLGQTTRTSEPAPSTVVPTSTVTAGDSRELTAAPITAFETIQSGKAAIAVPVRFNSAAATFGYMYMAEGIVTLTREGIAFEAAYTADPFRVTFDKILELNVLPLQQYPRAYQLHLKVAVLNKKGNKEDKKDYYFFAETARSVGGGQGGQGAVLDCGRCDDSMNTLGTLLERLRRK